VALHALGISGLQRVADGDVNAGVETCDEVAETAVLLPTNCDRLMLALAPSCTITALPPLPRNTVLATRTTMFAPVA
jgi:hypothetical protein